jgi:hypothetical protein
MEAAVTEVEAILVALAEPTSPAVTSAASAVAACMFTSAGLMFTSVELVPPELTASAVMVGADMDIGATPMPRAIPIRAFIRTAMRNDAGPRR